MQRLESPSQPCEAWRTIPSGGRLLTIRLVKRDMANLVDPQRVDAVNVDVVAGAEAAIWGLLECKDMFVPPGLTGVSSMPSHGWGQGSPERCQ